VFVSAARFYAYVKDGVVNHIGYFPEGPDRRAVGDEVLPRSMRPENNQPPLSPEEQQWLDWWSR
jgi:hypothetical protein